MSMTQVSEVDSSTSMLCRSSAQSAARPSRRPTRRRNPVNQDTEILEGLKAGDEAALKKLFDMHAAKLYRVAQRILADPADAEEIIQDVFWTAYRKAQSFKGEAQLSTWLYRLTVNAALGRIRRGRKKREVEYEEYLPKFQKDGHHVVRPVIDWSDTLEERYTQREIHSLVAGSLELLKPLDRSVLVLSDMEELADKEIAAALGLTVSAVKTRLHRARLFLRGRLAVRLGYSGA